MPLIVTHNLKGWRSLFFFSFKSRRLNTEERQRERKNSPLPEEKSKNPSKNVNI